jgi:hypothetical protein
MNTNCTLVKAGGNWTQAHPTQGAVDCHTIASGPRKKLVSTQHRGKQSEGSFAARLMSLCRSSSWRIFVYPTRSLRPWASPSFILMLDTIISNQVWRFQIQSWSNHPRRLQPLYYPTEFCTGLKLQDITSGNPADPSPIGRSSSKEQLHWGFRSLPVVLAALDRVTGAA